MADILPFKAYRYSKDAGDFRMLMSPLEENNSEKKEFNFSANSIAFLTSSPGPSMKGIINTWIENGVIRKDDLPAIYVYYQYYKSPNSSTTLCRKGFLSILKIQDWNERIVLKHEDIFPDIVAYQETLLLNSGIFLNPIHGLYTDAISQIEPFMEESMLHPLFEHTDATGVLHKLSAIQDVRCINEFIRVLKNKKIAIADGHHRYAAALNISNNDSSRKEVYISALLTNTVNNDIALLPFHRLFSIKFSGQEFINFLKPYVHLREEKNIQEIEAVINTNLHTFGIITRKTSYIIELKLEEFNLEHPSPLDLRILDELLTAKIPDFEDIKTRITYVHTNEACFKEVNSGNVDIAILVRKLTVDEVMELSEKGLILPEKSTYFFPKVLSGIVMSSTSSPDEALDLLCFKNI